MKSKRQTGHLAALVTIGIWGTTFISTKILLEEFQPAEILFFRFVMGYLVLLAACPRRLKKVSRGQELFFAAAGFSGICLYYLLENIALTYTMASNVGVITSTAPFFTAILSQLFIQSEEKLKVKFFAGFAIAMAGILMVSMNGSRFSLNPRGDFLAVSAAFVWGCYSILTKKITGFGYPVILTVRRTFFYGILFMMPVIFACGFRIEPARFTDAAYAVNLIYLGAGASALCFVTWNYAVKVLGAVKTSIYIYLVPVITIVTSVIILKEPVTWISAVGAVLTIAGLFLSEYTPKGKREE